ncbi:sulfide/dihydroorotate dehydrogenase-like FAD/NAD-binding protein [Clostridium sp. SHJSY1]|uniref:sulfide/dihydroorotate dehydrogenase-like FAD/NAD-binding protein n=1 Tax=Clostridium sp. SHJSY1 TaxID=2942483 RepID=UPI00287703E1|nr:sulfide/dihydroorotate dehydrogenase-like FAD/NAD-binding protein [Clostridium sp. SHJSY1]MDS0526102.1 sulfide/dihydroorotate dehydrogenase-like FAD/NAD-binding protein [Clostridium sp. SHJSY1]
MYKIVKKEKLNDNTYLMDIDASRVAKSAKPGQFIILKMDEEGERIPLTICDYNEDKGTVTIVFQVLGESTKEMAEYNVGDYFKDFVGPLGKSSELINKKVEELNKKNIIFIAGGVGTAPVYPQVKWLYSKGIKADVIVGARNKDIVILEKEMKEVCGNYYLATDDGSSGYKGLVTDRLKDLVKKEGKKYDLVIAIGPMVMMKFVTLLTKELNIPTVVSLNPIMVDGTGMCGACRVSVDGQIKFACVDGPEFDGHLVDFDEAMRRQAIYKTEEGRAILRAQEGDSHHGGCGICGGEN